MLGFSAILLLKKFFFKINDSIFFDCFLKIFILLVYLFENFQNYFWDFWKSKKDPRSLFIKTISRAY
ncbi:hypothetical protein HMPREF1557_00289 [Streptococcus sobrinus W1703]|uniref:Uncharacterized protein n=1 Tax=Streptococcus sobrinus W1703 TaxID=1227275 RepID=U2IWZ7_9STRE|nr:hypothetical protein HMPREF1557_00289 [Streptococcus sobrinus W1703]